LEIRRRGDRICRERKGLKWMVKEETYLLVKRIELWLTERRVFGGEVRPRAEAADEEEDLRSPCSSQLRGSRG
jgi:hypothetical protein